VAHLCKFSWDYGKRPSALSRLIDDTPDHRRIWQASGRIAGCHFRRTAATGGTFVLPTAMAPASRNRLTCGSSLAAISAARPRMPNVEDVPATSMDSFMLTGTP